MRSLCPWWHQAPGTLAKRTSKRMQMVAPSVVDKVPPCPLLPSRVDGKSGRQEWTARVDGKSGRQEWTARVNK
ncbi:hypothetical protein CBR_g4835 [Chara braunii]|uniref:Uncharacterized protein n=1 Tax=Chara braunii TaxID=69332 RepID=A0A388KJ27_CHABU|nr:hypothetical protein CBR_g4835 [Chara braunii]|eukprot:GBG70008.1 hypothetical protein CBR_g4835 [Chara braunii]